MFVDDDCVLNDGWWKWVEDNKVLEDASIGEIWCINYDFVDNLFRNTRQEFLKLASKEPFYPRY